MANIVHIASEMAGISQAGGLADVVSGLSVAQAAVGHQVTVILPLYANLPVHVKNEICWSGLDFTDCHTAGKPGRGGFGTVMLAGVTVIFIACDELYGRPDIYGYPDDAVRFLFLCRAALAIIERAPLAADVIHCHDWPASQALFLERRCGPARARTVFSIHNSQHQGVCDSDYPRYAGLDGYAAELCMTNGKFNMLAGAVRTADAVATVSPGFAVELARGEHCFGLKDVMASRRIIGILNGIDYDEFRAPVTKEAAKLTVCGEYGFNPQLPLIACIARACWQKGTDLLPAAICLAEPDSFNLAILACGSADEIAPLAELANFNNRQTALYSGQPQRTRTIALLAGADFVLMPSRFEPCGLVQLQGMALGCLPITTAFGGLGDTVTFAGKAKNGIRIDAATPAAVAGALNDAICLFADKRLLGSLVKNATAVRHTWQSAAAEYAKLYWPAQNNDR